jgi:hypothetical protein
MTPGALGSLERQMHDAAAAQQFERAASLRDQWRDLTWLAAHLARLRHAQEAMSFVYPLTGWDGATWWYLVHGARTLACVPAPRDAASADVAALALAACFGPKAAHLLTPYEHHDGRLIVMQWFAKYPAERAKTLTPEQARKKCQRWTPQSA